MALDGTVAPGQGEPRLDRREVLLQALGKAGEHCNPACRSLGYPCLELGTSTLPHKRQKGLAQRIRLRDHWVRLGQLVNIQLRILRPLGFGAHPGEGDRTGRRALRAGIGRGLGLRRPARGARLPQPCDEARDGPCGVGIAEGACLAPELHTVRAPLPPALDQIRHIRPHHLARPLRTAGTRRPGSAQVRIDGGTAEPKLRGNRRDRRPLGAEGVNGLVARDSGGVSVLLCCLLPLLPGLGAPVAPPVYGRGGHRAGDLRECLRRTHRGGLESRALIMQKGLDRLPQVFDQMKPIHDLGGMRGATANAVRIECTAIPTDDRNRWMLGEPLRHRVCRALRQEVQDLVIFQIDQDRAIALPASPGPLIDPQHLRGRSRRRRGLLHQPQQGGGTGVQPQPVPELCPRLPAEGQAAGTQALREPQGAAGPRRGHGGQAFRKNLAGARRLVTKQCPYAEDSVG
jgi:hypothetical protein